VIEMKLRWFTPFVFTFSLLLPALLLISVEVQSLAFIATPVTRLNPQAPLALLLTLRLTHTQPSALLVDSLSSTVEPIQGQPPIPKFSQNPPAKVKPLELIGYLPGLGQEEASSGGAFDIAGDILCLIANETDVRVINIADPTQPHEVSLYQTDTPLAKIVIWDQYAFVAGTEGLLQILDISNPLKLREVGRYHPPKRISWLLALNLANPGAPAEISRLKVMAGDLAARGDYVYITNAPGGLQLLEVSVSTKSVRVQRFPELTGQSLVLKDNSGYMVTNTEGLRLLDLSDPARPVEAGVVGLGLEGVSWGGLQRAAIGEDYVYLSGYDALHAINISDPTTPYEAGYSFIPNGLQAMTLVDSYSYVTGTEGDLFICQIEKF
jgi:hypothetical protein